MHRNDVYSQGQIKYKYTFFVLFATVLLVFVQYKPFRKLECVYENDL